MDTPMPVPAVSTAKSIEEMEGVAWPSPSLRSYVATTSFALRRKPLLDLTAEEVRIGLGQQVGVGYLVPLAIERLAVNPLLEASLYEGDLLRSLLEVPLEYWQGHPELRLQVASIAAAAFDQAPRQDADWQSTVLPLLREAFWRFTGHSPSRAWLRPAEGRAPPV